MSAAEKAQTRAKLRVLSNTVQERRAELTSVTSSGISGVIKEANDLHVVSSQDTRAAAVDANLLSNLAVLGAEQAGNLEKVSPELFVSCLGGEFGIGTREHGNAAKNINWHRLGEKVWECGVYSLTPGVNFFLGTYNGPVVKKARERRQKDRAPTGPMETAESVDVSQLQEQQEDKAQVARIKVLMRTLEEHANVAKAAGRPARVNFFELVLHPT